MLVVITICNHVNADQLCFCCGSRCRRFSDHGTTERERAPSEQGSLEKVIKVLLFRPSGYRAVNISCRGFAHHVRKDFSRQSKFLSIESLFCCWSKVCLQ